MLRKARPTRRFALVDGMILVAATGVGVALLRPYLASFKRPNFVNSPSMRAIETTYGIWSTVAACWMLALLVIQSRRPRPPLGRLVRRPGHVACCVAAVALAWGALHGLVEYLCLKPGWASFYSFQQTWIAASVPIGPAVEGAWIVLALSGRWRNDPGWVDRLGRFLGSLWVAWGLFWLLPGPIRAKIPPFWDGLLP